MTLKLSGEVDRQAAENPGNYSVKVWSLKRTASYGSKHYDEKSLAVKSAKLGADGQTVALTIKGVSPTWCMEIKYRLKSIGGKTIDGTIHNTIHHLKR